MKKIFFAIMFMCVLSLSVVISAADESTYIYEYSELNLSVEFAETSVLSHDERQRVADSIANNVPMQQTYSLCWLLGHDIYHETVSALYHEKSEHDPRCQLEIYDVEKCENCDYVYA
ncbi:MAG: hypothetical protein IJ334_12305, partial [Clostridia bacterium]|nr:hypothetical protein [Clostridia bacterium]